MNTAKFDLRDCLSRREAMMATSPENEGILEMWDILNVARKYFEENF